MIPQLPFWSIPDIKPAIYDVDSKTCVEMTGKLYAKIKELIDSYNSFTEQINLEMQDFKDMTKEEQQCFENRITCIINNYIDVIDHKMLAQDIKIQNAEDYMQNNIEETTQLVVNQAITNGEITITTSYNSETEDLSINITNGGGE